MSLCVICVRNVTSEYNHSVRLVLCKCFWFGLCYSIVNDGSLQMDNKFLIACCLFSFITGMYIAHMIDKDQGCTVTFDKGHEMHILIGRK